MPIFCALTDPMATHPRNASQTPFRLSLWSLNGGSEQLERAVSTPLRLFPALVRPAL